MGSTSWHASGWLRPHHPRQIYLHEVLDEWFTRQVAPRLVGRAHLIRYAMMRSSSLE